MRRDRRARLYADEDVEDEVVAWLRENDVNIKSARELPGHRGKPDEFHAAYAFRNRRFLLTKNGKHFFNDRALPWDRLHGLVVIEGDMSDEHSFAVTTNHVLRMVVPYGDSLQRTKLRFSATRATLKQRTWEGRVETRQFRFARGRVYEWVNRR